jgi:hypothetical protein
LLKWRAHGRGQGPGEVLTRSLEAPDTAYTMTRARGECAAAPWRRWRSKLCNDAPRFTPRLPHCSPAAKPQVYARPKRTLPFCLSISCADGQPWAGDRTERRQEYSDKLHKEQMGTRVQQVFHVKKRSITLMELKNMKAFFNELKDGSGLGARGQKYAAGAAHARPAD